MSKRSIPRCRICRRPLAAAESITRGVGPECAEKFLWTLSEAGLTLQALGIPERLAETAEVKRHLRLAEEALLAGRRDHMQRFKCAAQEAARRLAAS